MKAALWALASIADGSPWSESGVSVIGAECRTELPRDFKR